MAARKVEHRKVEHTVTEADTAETLGSGDLPVLATPRLVNWLERAAYASAQEVIEPGLTTVGTVVRLEHLKGCPVGTVLTLKCSKPISDGRRLIFHVGAIDDVGDEVATGEMHRWVIDPDRFMSRFPVPEAVPEGADVAPTAAPETTPEPRAK